MGQIVAGELALAVLLVAMTQGPMWLALAAPVALLVLAMSFVRARGQWAYRWLALAVGYAARRRVLPPGNGPAALLALLRPDVQLHTVELDGAPVGVLADPAGVTAVLEVGDSAAVLLDPGQAVPAPATLLPAIDQPPARLQMVTAAVAAPAPWVAAGSPAASYRQLTEGRLAAYRRTLLAVQVARPAGWPEADLHRALASAVRRVRRRLPGRPLGPDGVARVLDELAHRDATLAVREHWSAIETGGLREVTFRVHRFPDPASELAGTLLDLLATLPGCAATVSLAVRRTPREGLRGALHVRLAAPDAELAAAIEALGRLLSMAGAQARRLDGAHLPGLDATLPLGGAPYAWDAPVTPDNLAAVGLRLDGGGLMLGVNRHAEPVAVRLFRAEPTRAALVGGLSAAQLLAVRALAVGARVTVQTGRPHAWEPFQRGVNGRSDALRVVALGQSAGPVAATAHRPELVVVDGAAAVPVPEGPWRTTLLIRDQLTTADLDLLARADLAVLQPLTVEEAALAGSALGLGDTADWFTRIHDGMLGVVVPRRALRWALASPTPIERQLIGGLSR